MVREVWKGMYQQSQEGWEEVQIKQQCLGVLAQVTILFADGANVLVANLWMGFLLYGAQNLKK
jgi:hypothetical protein